MVIWTILAGVGAFASIFLVHPNEKETKGTRKVVIEDKDDKLESDALVEYPLD